MRRWELHTNSPFNALLAADASLNISNAPSTPDQVWKLHFGEGESAALALQTRYQGQVGLASIVPMWQFDGRIVYQHQAYLTPPFITAFAPGYLRVLAKLDETLGFRADYWTINPQAVGGRFTIMNRAKKPREIQLDLFVDLISENQQHKIGAYPLSKNEKALSLGRIGNTHPVILLKGALATPDQKKLSTALTIQPDQKVSIEWVHVSKSSLSDSVKAAQKLLNQNWLNAFNEITMHASTTPIIETGDPDIDVTLAAAYQHAMQAIVKSDSLPHATLISARNTEYRPKQNEQTPPLTYLTALALAPVNAKLAQGLVQNYLATQHADGWIDWTPGNKQDLLCLPILARLTWSIFQYTEDEQFLREAFPKLLRFFDRWFEPDLDQDGDGVPEWQSEAQTGFPILPAFSIGRPWGQHADIRTVETPDLVAYLISEAASLHEIGYYLRDTAATSRLTDIGNQLENTLSNMWHESSGRFAYRDRDTHITTHAVTLVENGGGSETTLKPTDLTPPNRLVIEISGGWEHTPRMTVTVEGINRHDQPITETADATQFTWAHGRGAFTTTHVFKRIDRLQVEGLSRVYKVDVRTLDTTYLDITALLPLWSIGIPTERAQATIDLLSAQFARPNGVAMNTAQDQHITPDTGVSAYWLTLLGEGLLEYQQPELAADLLKRLLKVQATVLRERKAFTMLYHSTEPRGMGELGHVGGIAPLHLFMRVIGVRIVSSSTVWTGGKFVWSHPVTIKQHGVTVQRSDQGTQVQFPNGQRVTLPPDAEWQAVEMPQR